LLSRLLIAFTTEFDNEAEHRLEHRTTRGADGGTGRGPWLVSQAMWANFMQFVPGHGVPLHEVDDLARITNLAGLQRWGYVTVGPDPADGRPAPPRYLPVVTHEMFADIADLRPRPPTGGGPPPDLSVLLSQVLLAFTLDFERKSAQEEYLRLLDAVEQRWRTRFGAAAIGTLRRSLLSVTGQRDDGRPRLALGLRPYPDGGGRGGPTSARPPPCSTTPELRCPTTRWCCTVAGGPTAADTPGAGGGAGPGWAAPGRPGQDGAVIGRLHHVVVDCPDPVALAGFYSELLGLPITWQEEDFAVVARDDKSSGIGFQLAPDFQPPQWPGPGRPQQIHFDVMVDDVDAAEPRVLALGARRLTGGDGDSRVFADPAGHPFCLIPRPGWAAPIGGAPGRE